MKTSALDYLIDFVNNEKDLWLKGVVVSYLNSNGNINDSELDRLVKELLSDKREDRSPFMLTPSLTGSSTIKIKKVKHESGINALARNQKIVFGEQATVLYGLNGSGKSSYFRILQGMIGNLSKAEIIPNIYLESPQAISTSIEYSVDSKIKAVTWNNTGQINDLQTIKVFDSKYSRTYLTKRESDEQIIKPYKLYVFSEISDYIDQIKNMANENLKARKEKIVVPQLESFTDEIKVLFEKEAEEKDKILLDSIAKSFDTAQKNELISVQADIKSLTETDYNDKIKIVENNIMQCKQLKKRLEDVLIPWIENSKEYHNQKNLYDKYKKESKENRKKIEVLKDLPGADSDEWKTFIQSGLAISSKVENLKEECPYCHQLFDDRALAIVQAYSIFINDTTEGKLSQAQTKIHKIVSNAKSVKIIESDYQFSEIPELQPLISSLLQDVQEYIDTLVQMDESFNDVKPIKNDTELIMKKINEYLENAVDEVSKIKNNASVKEETLKKKKRREAELISKKSIHDQIDIIDKYFDESLSLNKQKKRIDSASSRKITNISARAHEDLLTEQLRTQFIVYLKLFGIIGREIELASRSSKGKQQTELIMKAQSDVTKILSEGEQKAVSIALFLAEISVAQNKSTIILDDPVSSFDYKMMGRLIDTLLQLENQVIIFTHSRMFLDTIAGSDYGHLCKNFHPGGCNKKNKGKHIFVYEIKSEGLNDVGIITSQIKNDARGYLEEAKTCLEQSPFSEELKVCALLRKAVEHIIDEVVFNRQVPRKYSIKGGMLNIHWDELKEMAKDPNVIDELKEVHGKVSSGELHLGLVNLNNPPDKAELIRLYNTLDGMLSC